jgi:hypothetical protein
MLMAALSAAACSGPPATQAESSTREWRIPSVASAAPEPAASGAASAILAYLQDTDLGRALAAGKEPLCIGLGPASGGPFRFQPLYDLDPALLRRIAETRANARPVSDCATTLKGAPYFIAATGEPARLLACLNSGATAPGTISLLCGFYDSPIAAEFVGYDVELAANEAIVRRNGKGIRF